MTREELDVIGDGAERAAEAAALAKVRDLRELCLANGYDSVTSAVAEAVSLRRALAWVSQVHPGKDADGAAVIEMTWSEWNSLRRALGLKEQREPRSPTLST